jgi:Ulp1 family protease
MLMNLVAVQTRQWARVYNRPGTPQQRNGVDCGVFAIMAASYCGADKAFDYGQPEVYTFFRAMVALECYHLRLRSL